mgnify:CR=1 FL=1
MALNLRGRPSDHGGRPDTRFGARGTDHPRNAQILFSSLLATRVSGVDPCSGHVKDSGGLSHWNHRCSHHLQLPVTGVYPNRVLRKQLEHDPLPASIPDRALHFGGQTADNAHTN